MRPFIDDRWIEYFKANGYPLTTGIATGMEGAVYSLVPKKIIAKVWSNKPVNELIKLQTFYDKLYINSSSIQTPKIIEIKTVDNTVISIEQFLKGTPLNQFITEDLSYADEKGINATIEVLNFLKSVPIMDEFKSLAILDESRPLWSKTNYWGDNLNELMLLRYSKFKNLLQSDIPDIENIIDDIGVFLKTRNNINLSLIHGDLCGCNIMVEANLTPTSVFDFGFLSSIGDPAFDASISSSIFNMYGPHANIIEKDVTVAIAKAFGYDINLLLAYKAVYAIITSNAYGKDRTDGHYQWCVRMLGREDVRHSLSTYTINS